MKKLLFKKNNNQSSKNWVYPYQPFEYYPDWKAFLTMLSDEIPSFAWLVEDQYLRRGLRLKSVSIAFQQLAEMPGGRTRKHQPSKFTQTRTFSSGPKLAVFDFNNSVRFNHDYG